MSINPIDSALFRHRVSALCREMAAVLRQTAVSANIRDRLDFSCAIFDAQACLVEQHAAIPVHLGSMAMALAQVVDEIDWLEGHQMVLNDPFAGGTHLPDVTLIAPVMHHRSVVAYVANRAHHADIGSDSPGSMPLATRLDQEGLIISPIQLTLVGLKDIADQCANPLHSLADFSAQWSANRVAVDRLQERLKKSGSAQWNASCAQLAQYTRGLAQDVVRAMPDGCYSAQDVMDSDGQGYCNVPLALSLRIDNDQIIMDFSGSSAQVSGNINCPLSVTAAAAFYVLRCLSPSEMPTCGALMDVVTLVVPEKSVLNAEYPAAVAAGNVETSMRLVDLICRALSHAIPKQIPAASQGTMNNIAMGGLSPSRWDFYETLAGGAGACQAHPGASAVHSHMTNTLNTPVEIMESCYPLRVMEYALRPPAPSELNSDRPCHRGGRGLIRTIRFLQAAELTVITERRVSAPWGLNGAPDGRVGENRINAIRVDDKIQRHVEQGDVLSIVTPDGGGYGLGSVLWQ